jgi:hypothetical protein
LLDDPLAPTALVVLAEPDIHSKQALAGSGVVSGPFLAACAMAAMRRHQPFECRQVNGSNRP